MKEKKNVNRKANEKNIVDNIKDKDQQNEREELQNGMIDYNFDDKLLINNGNDL